MIAGTRCEIMEDESSVFITGTDWNEFWTHVQSTILIMIVLTIIALVSDHEEGLLFVAGAVMVCSQLLWQLKNNSEREALKAQRLDIAELREAECQKQRGMALELLQQANKNAVDKKKD
eukprot:Gregarina_sp_Poly_1__7546@NODE_4220_length_681_cov_6_724756_g2785_i0_p1_GENE_NODE_4220_length_681_cov_6_724756_g2785_i0NODE_4220_length_681_cov_6_724756_g2785_i0_p1_ORF_typecomplete_len119_score18_19DUF3487/PF11990_8/0_11_NODE_4220_length_681_cov_6_724756_g2785_i0254610